MFSRMSKLYQSFATEGLGASKLLKEIERLVDAMGVRDDQLERALNKAWSTENMVDVEFAKELFHRRLRKVDAELLKGWKPDEIFDAPIKKPGHR